jgi:RND superfamily putative drug exporter
MTLKVATYAPDSKDASLDIFASRSIFARMVRGKTFSAAKATRTRTLGARWVGIVMRRPVLAAGVVVVALGALAIPALDVRLGLPNDGTANPDTTQRQAYDLVSEGFGVGANGQLTLVAPGPPTGPPPTRRSRR